MILEIAILNLHPGQQTAYKAAFQRAAPIIRASPGYLSHELQHCLETPDRYVLLVRWQTLEDHTVGFRGSVPYQTWREILHPFYASFSVEHYELVESEANRQVS